MGRPERVEDAISLSGKDGSRQKTKSFINELGRGTVSFTDEEFDMIKRFVERRGRDAAHVTAASVDTAQYSRARSPRNLLVSGNECGRVFPAGVGPGSPSRDAANWLPSRFSLSVETRRRYGWLRMMVFPGARLFPSPNLVPFGRVAARERQGALSRRTW